MLPWIPVVVAVVSAVVALVSALLVERGRRRAGRELEELKERFARQQAERDRRDRIADLVAAYRNPLLRAAYDLQSRIYNIHGGFRGSRDPEYFTVSTVYVIAEFLGWLEIIRRETQFLDLGEAAASGRLKAQLDLIQGTLASTSRRRAGQLYLYRGEQRAIGELMIVTLDDPMHTGVRSTCLGLAEFAERIAELRYTRWLRRLQDRVADLQPADLDRLTVMQHDLIDLIDMLDPDRVRFATNREKLPRSG
ncbi:hypothetical protein [Pseudonocardia sp. HH130630-07]|uniref:hypothetical protein n=1 Tax=Pseudonocardia sp. HH130630-07 TaxID=1690815 RepID=UPI000815053A|nr:hypothetical protein [Pseudonocardia sp. HH130630-07]ANY08409.1 hypothetical protein AFB00_21415 [Pseudonocardia sp. HH130630-07]